MSNKDLKKHFKNHKCLNCEKLRYWDWYYCNARNMHIWNYSIREIFRWIKNYISDAIEIIRDDLGSPLQHIKHQMRFLPSKPIRKCNKFIKRDVDFWKE